MYDINISISDCDLTERTQIFLMISTRHASGVSSNAAAGSGPIKRSPIRYIILYVILYVVIHHRETTPEEFRGVIDVNLIAAFLMTRAVVPTLMAQRWGRIINVTTSLDTMWRSPFRSMAW